jgi:hypothetical protein
LAPTLLLSLLLLLLGSVAMLLTFRAYGPLQHMVKVTHKP